MDQDRLNNCIILHCRKTYTDKVDEHRIAKIFIKGDFFSCQPLSPHFSNRSAANVITTTYLLHEELHLLYRQDKDL
jgi:hypothetical protein